MRSATVASQRRVPGNTGIRSRQINSPAVAQLAQLNKHGARVRTLAEVRECTTQARDDSGTLQPEERVDVLFLSERGNGAGSGILPARFRQQGHGLRLVGFPIQGELEIACQVLMARKHACAVRQARELRREGVVQRFRATTVMTISS